MAVDRDTALRAILDLVLKILSALDADSRDMAADIKDMKASILRIESLLKEIEGHLRISPVRSMLRLLDRAADRNPVQTLALLGSFSTVAGCFTVSGLYAIIWHESPAVVMGALLSLFHL